MGHMARIHITAHAARRYQERVRPCPPVEMIDALNTPAILVAAAFAGTAECSVRLATGQRIVVKDGAIITIIPADQHRRRERYRAGKFMHDKGETE